MYFDDKYPNLSSLPYAYLTLNSDSAIFVPAM